jgi:class 3 adenylate cyclase/YHS domain-containing protein
MESDLAILIADLTGYTALTDVHGAYTAADLIDRFIGITETCLVGDSHLHQRTGDEILIISSSANDLVATAAMLLQQTSGEDRFLQLHGGLHYGPLLKRNDSYFGNTINLASRIAAKANPGTFWCSAEFVNVLENKSHYSFIPKGELSFKNVIKEREVFELVVDNCSSLHVDPICKMLISDTDKAYQHSDKFFCSSECMEIFLNRQGEHT